MGACTSTGKAVEKAGVPRYRIHDRRHTVATHPTMAGMSAREVAESLGHSSASLVLEVYGHVAPTTHRKSADLLDGMLARQRQAT
jgi:integrase